MKVPSYDDLTPSIPDIHPRDTFDQVMRLVPADAAVVDARRPASVPDPGALFACITIRNRAHGTAVMALAREFSPRIERHGDDCVVLDVSGLGRLLGDAHGIGAELARTASERGVKGTISIAPTQTAARLLALADMEPRVVTGDAAAAIDAIPFDTLQHLFVRPLKLFDIVRRWGIRSAGEFAALPAAEVASRFGQDGIAVQRLACGLDAHPLVPDPGVPRFVQMMELEWPLEALEPLSFVFARLLEPLASALERADRAGAAVRLELRLVDKTTHVRMLQLPAPIRDPRVLRTLLLLDLESHPPTAAVDTVTIEVDPAPSRIVQYSLLERATPSPETLATLTARLSALTGEDRCGSPVLMDSFRPDAFAMTRFNPQERRTCSPATGMNDTAATLCLRRFRPPVAVRVAVERGRPVHVAIDRKGMPGGRVEQAAGPWRSSGSWWNATGEHWDRDEWDAALADGTVCRLYLDRVSEHWFMDAVID